MSRWRKRREPAVQDWLCRVKRIRAIMPSMTQSSLASAKTIEGLLPPSSSETGTMRSEAARMMSLPTSVDPVNESLLTVGEHAWRQELLAHFGQQQHTERRILRRFQNKRIAGAERRADLAGREQHRRIPRDDGSDHAERLTSRVAQDMLT